MDQRRKCRNSGRFDANKARSENELKLREFERLREEYLKQQTEKETSEIEETSDAISIESIDMYVRENAEHHNTSKFDLLSGENPPLIIRRGQPFHFAILFQRQYDLNEDIIKIILYIEADRQINKGTLIELPVTYNSSFTKPKDQWDIRLSDDEAKLMHLHVQVPYNTIVGLWKIKIETTRFDKIVPRVSFTENNPNISIYILFNPWSKDDSVFMDDEQGINEYVQNEIGIISYGSYKQPFTRRWIYGQFSIASLPAAMYVLGKSSLKYSARRNPVKVVRALSAMVNSENNEGVIEGRWDGSYDDGIAPWMWTGSSEILGKYLRNGGNIIKYGQCLVFAAVFTTLCRALGIPCRPVTNFVSAHDTDDTLTVDRFFDEEGNILKANDDSVWNYHVWNDCWMSRPDLPAGYGGWQAVDGTPQETSDGIYQAGPASLEAVRRGQVGYLYDSPFIFSEVNADIVHWKQDDSKSIGWSKLNTYKYHIGRFILTKKVGNYDVEDITSQYKNREGTDEERIAIRNAVTYGNYTELFDMPTKDQEDVFFNILDMDKIMIGQPFNIILSVENRSNKQRTIYAVMELLSVYYTGIKAYEIMDQKGDLTLKPEEKTTITMTVSGDEYYDRLVDYSMMKIYMMATVKETKQIWCDEDDFSVEKPRLNLKVSTPLKVEEKFRLSATFTNPLNRQLQECVFVVEGPGLTNARRTKFKDILPSETVTYKDDFIPQRRGKKDILVVFTSKQLIDIQGTIEMEIS